MKKLSSFLREGKDKGAVFTFGRFNPPTTGHAKLVDKLKKASSGGYKPLLFTSHSNDKKKNPLSHKQKISYLIFQSTYWYYMRCGRIPFHPKKNLPLSCIFTNIIH